MKHNLLFAILLLCSSAHSQIFWGISSAWRSNGWCRLEQTRIVIDVHRNYVNVEEEALLTTGDNSNNYPEGREIFGRFTLTEGSVLRSMLLWDEDVILKAKLYHRNAAQREYDMVMNGDQPETGLTDAALIEYEGNNRYFFKIYPVEKNSTRRIRILYTVPLTAKNEQIPGFAINTTFSGINPFFQMPSTVALEINFGPTALDSYRLHFAGTKRTVTSSVVYMIPAITMYNTTFNLFPDVQNYVSASVTQISEGNAPGHYTAVFSSIPDSLRNIIEEDDFPQNSTIEVRVSTGEKVYIFNLQEPRSLGLHMKSSSPWDSVLTWNIYNQDGRILLSYDQVIEPDTADSGMLPLLWGAKYSLKEMQGSLGAVFGFVDNQMSLLALRSDSLSSEDIARYAFGGVPPLEPDEIITEPDRFPSVPREYVLFEPTSVVNHSSELSLPFRVRILPNALILLCFRDNVPGLLSAFLYDAKGRVVYKWNRTGVSDPTVQLNYPHSLKGVFFLKVETEKEIYRSKIILH